MLLRCAGHHKSSFKSSLGVEVDVGELHGVGGVGQDVELVLALRVCPGSVADAAIPVQAQWGGEDATNTK